MDLSQYSQYRHSEFSQYRVTVQHSTVQSLKEFYEIYEINEMLKSMELMKSHVLIYMLIYTCVSTAGCRNTCI